MQFGDVAIAVRAGVVVHRAVRIGHALRDQVGPVRARRQRAVAAVQRPAALGLDVEAVGRALGRVLEDRPSPFRIAPGSFGSSSVAGSRAIWPASTAACASSMTGRPFALDLPEVGREAGLRAVMSHTRPSVVLVDFSGLQVRVAALDERRRDAPAVGGHDGRWRHRRRSALRSARCRRRSAPPNAATELATFSVDDGARNALA